MFISSFVGVSILKSALWKGFSGNWMHICDQNDKYLNEERNKVVSIMSSRELLELEVFVAIENSCEAYLISSEPVWEAHHSCSEKLSRASQKLSKAFPWKSPEIGNDARIKLGILKSSPELCREALQSCSKKTPQLLEENVQNCSDKLQRTVSRSCPELCQEALHSCFAKLSRAVSRSSPELFPENLEELSKADLKISPELCRKALHSCAEKHYRAVPRSCTEKQFGAGPRSSRAFESCLQRISRNNERNSLKLSWNALQCCQEVLQSYSENLHSYWEKLFKVVLRNSSELPSEDL